MCSLKDGGQRYFGHHAHKVCAPFIRYCYYNVIRTLRDTKKLGGGGGDGGSRQQNKKRTEAIRLLAVLTCFYYVSHSAFFISYAAIAFADANIVRS